ncbi:MAG TPA: hypothetical protein VKX46_11945, partial [Ktedonobacteraceae bacterium]|nr:hypothetical protein [Ktedonobacteraceae bacterium]
MSEHVGELFSLYRLVRFLAAGEHADLYLGKNVYTGTFFTLKMAADPLDEETNEQLITEARLLSRFD